MQISEYQEFMMFGEAGLKFTTFDQTAEPPTSYCSTRTRNLKLMIFNGNIGSEI